MKEDKPIRAICENCGITFYALWDRLDHTGFLHLIRSESKQVIKDFTFCCYDCEKAFVERMEKRHPEIKGDWTPATADQMTRFPEYYEERTCALCGSKKELRLSHITPRFVVKWLKYTSASGFLRTADPGNRIQDSLKINLLCEDCEESFSVWENYFADKLFYPYQKGMTEILYDEWLAKFAVSISWRLLRVYAYELTDDYEKKGFVEAALETWKNYLLDGRADPGDYENHVFMLGDLDISSVELPEKFLWYVLRSIDQGMAVFDDGRIFIFAKFPAVLFISTINPRQFRGWEASKIGKKGGIKLPQKMTYEDALRFLMKRSSLMTRVPLSETELNKIAGTMMSRPDRILGSKTLETLLAEGKRRRNKLIGKLNPVVRQLLEILGSIRADERTSPEAQALLDFGLHLIADTLVQLPRQKAEQLEKEESEAILNAKSTNSDSSSVSDLGNIVVALHVMPKSTREQRIQRIEESFIQIEKDQLFPKAEEILILAWNPLNDKPSFELSFEIDRSA